MRQFQTYGEDSSAESPIQKIIQGAFGNPVELSAAPSTSGGELANSGDAGYFGANLYINLGGTLYRFTGTAV